MKIAVLSDSHDHLGNLRKALDQVVKRHVETIIFCGDLCAPFTASILGSVEVPVYACLGNVDEDQITMAEKGGKNITWTGLAKEFGEVKLDGKNIAFVHYPKLAELLAKKGDYDAVFHGHTHVSRNEKVANTLLVNPGPVCGIHKGKYKKATYAIYNTTKQSAVIVNINE